MASAKPWLRWVRSWASKRWRRWRRSSSLTRSWPGTAHWLPSPELEACIVRMAQENRSWGYDRIVGALANLGYTVSDQTVGNILKRHGILPAPERKTTTTW